VLVEDCEIMEITSKFKLNLKTKEVESAVQKAGRLGMRDTVVAMARDVIHDSPVLTAHNRRSIVYDVGGKITKTGSPKAGEKPFIEWSPDVGTLEGAIYSTSGYGGYLEVGTTKMPARPYFKPAYDRHIKELPINMKRHFEGL